MTNLIARALPRPVPLESSMTDLIAILLRSLSYAVASAKTSAEAASHHCRTVEQAHAAATTFGQSAASIALHSTMMNARAAAEAASLAYTAAESAYAAAQEVAACHTEAAPAALARLLAKRR